MINAILLQSEEARKYAIVTYDGNSIKRIWCENCGKQGHKFYECPEKIKKAKSKVMCQHCQSTSHPSNDCPDKAKQRALDPKSNMLSIEANRLLTVEDELNDFMEEVERERNDKDHLKSITYEAINQNAQKAYEEQRDIGELVQEHQENEEYFIEKSRALVLAEKQD